MTLRFGTTTEQDLFNITGRRNFVWKLLLVLRCNARALLEIRDELRRLNDGRDQFNAAMLEFFERLSRDPESPSEAGATAQGETTRSNTRPKVMDIDDDKSGFDLSQDV
jgi:hypothetical protein